MTNVVSHEADLEAAFLDYYTGQGVSAMFRNVFLKSLYDARRGLIGWSHRDRRTRAARERAVAVGPGHAEPHRAVPVVPRGTAQVLRPRRDDHRRRFPQRRAVHADAARTVPGLRHRPRRPCDGRRGGTRDPRTAAGHPGLRLPDRHRQGARAGPVDHRPRVRAVRRHHARQPDLRPRHQRAGRRRAAPSR